MYVLKSGQNVMYGLNTLLAKAIALSPWQQPRTCMECVGMCIVYHTAAARL